MPPKSSPSGSGPQGTGQGAAARPRTGRNRRSGSGSYGRTRREEEARRRRLRWLTLGTAAVIVLAVVLAVAATRQSDQEAAPDDVFALDRQPALGSADAPVTVVEFADFKCPYCRDFSLNEFPRFKEAYIDTGKVRFYFINYPFIGPDSPTAAEAMEAVYAQSPEGVWAFVERLMELQGPEDQEWATPEFLVDVARQAVPGIDAERLLDDLRSGRYRDEVEADQNIARRVGVRGTPSVFVNGKFVENWSFAGLKAAVDEALAERGEAKTGDAKAGAGEGGGS